MTIAEQTIRETSKTICALINAEKTLGEGVLSQTILIQLRTLVNAFATLLYLDETKEYHDYSFTNYRDHVKKFLNNRKSDYKFLLDFNNCLDASSSHGHPNESIAKTLLLKYLDWLYDIKEILQKRFNIGILENLQNLIITMCGEPEHFYFDIALIIDSFSINPQSPSFDKEKYRVVKQKPFFINGKKYYEISLTPAIEGDSKFNRFIVFSKSQISTNYSIKVSTVDRTVDMFRKKVPIKILLYWDVSINRCEINDLYRIFFNELAPKDVLSISEYKNLMFYLKDTRLDLLDIILLSDSSFLQFQANILGTGTARHLSLILNKCRDIVLSNKPGSNVIRYLLFIMDHSIAKQQLNFQENEHLSSLFLSYRCIPFDTTPFASGLIFHVPNYDNLVYCIPLEGREDELIVRHIQCNAQNRNRLYTDKEEIEDMPPVEEVNRSFLSKVYPAHRGRRKIMERDEKLFVNGYESDTLQIIQLLKEYSKIPDTVFCAFTEQSFFSGDIGSDSEEKKALVSKMFKQSSVSIVTGAAGTGKTTLMRILCQAYRLFDTTGNILVLAQTHPAISNIKRKLSPIPGCEYRTISSFINWAKQNSLLIGNYSMLIVDECSVVPNDEMVELLSLLKYHCKKIVLTGDEFQIESITFGNWFRIASRILPKGCVNELKEPHRGKDSQMLCNLWKNCREGSSTVLELLAAYQFSSDIDESIFYSECSDEIILCLNYGGFYGINNLNLLLQSNNQSRSCIIAGHLYKVNDPILFNEVYRFSPYIYNNLKGTIIDFAEDDIKVTFRIKLSVVLGDIRRAPNGLFVEWELLDGKTVVRFDVLKDRNYDDDEPGENLLSFVPFQVSYAISIHKAQGLEYDSVKIVISDEVGEIVSPNLFYTAITRTKEKLKVFWSGETAAKICEKMSLEYKDDSDINTFIGFHTSLLSE